MILLTSWIFLHLSLSGTIASSIFDLWSRLRAWPDSAVLSYWSGIMEHFINVKTLFQSILTWQMLP